MQLGTFWGNLTRPHPSISDIEQRRQSRLLAGLVVAITVSSFLASVLLIVNAGGIKDPTVVFVWVANGINLIIYGLNRSGRYWLSASLFLALNLLLALLLPFSGSLQWAFFATMALILSAILMPPRVTWTVFLLTLVSQVILRLTRPEVTIPMGAISPIIIFGVTAPLVLVFLTHRAGLERERQAELQAANQKLRESEAMLERRVEERTQELRVAKEEAEIARERAEAADRTKSLFLASMSHELRTPLNAILNFTEMMALGMVDPVTERQKDILTKSLNSGRHLLALINDVLDVTKIQSGMLTLFCEENLNLYPELEAVAAVAETLLQDKPVQFVQNIDEALPTIGGDRRRIRQILLNLVGNAAKFTEQGTITLSAQASGDEVLFVVRDTGPGISREQQVIIFEPFVQTETGMKHSSGTGLGLPISKWLVEAHGGRLWVESELGQGATFYVTLPQRISDTVSNGTRRK